ncbi:MAG: transketolase-like TK C-terminal-containing protein [Dehalococcoidia bacterium]|jgi:transketolase
MASSGSSTVTVHSSSTDQVSTDHVVNVPDYDRQRLEDVGFVASMTFVLMCNYHQTGHFGGPTAYMPYTVATHLAGPENGGMTYDYRRPKHPYADKFMLAGGHNAPATYALWMIMGEALARKHAATGDDRYKADPEASMLAIDSLGFRRGAGALKTILEENDLADHPAMAQAKIRGIRALSGHSETTDLTNDVNGGPSGVGIATAAGKAAFWDMMGAPSSLKIMAIEGEFALTSGHSQEFKTQAVAQRVGKRLRVLMSYNNAGIDDELIGSVVKEDTYRIEDQWTSYGWNVIKVDNATDYDQVVGALKTMEYWDESDRRPMIVIGNTLKGFWPGAKDGKLPGDVAQIVDHASHAYGMPMNGEYFQALATSFEEKYGVTFEGIRDGAVSDNRERLLQLKTNIDIALSVLDQDGLGDWLAERLVEIGDQVNDNLPLRVDSDKDPFLDERLLVKNLPTEATTVTATNPVSGETKDVDITLFEQPGAVKGTRRAISEIIKWANYVTENRFVIVAADLAESINVDHGSIWGHYDPLTNQAGTRLKAPIQEAGNALTAVGFTSQTLSKDPDKFNGVWSISGTYGAFTPLMYLPLRVWSQQNQDSPFRMGVAHILAGHSGPETAADARTHFGIFSPQVWKLFPKGQAIVLSFWDYNDVAPGYFAAAEIAARDPKVGIIVMEVARPDFAVADRSTFADTDPHAAAKGFYLIRDYDPEKPKHGVVISQGSSSTVNLVKVLPQLEEAGVNVKVVAAISEELFDRQSQEYRDSVLSDQEKVDTMVVTTGTRRVWPVTGLGVLTDEYSLTSDWDHQWLSGGTEDDVIKEAHLDTESIYDAVKKFADDRDSRLSRQAAAFNGHNG